jgi:short-subunit dehydrogenase
MNNHTKKIAIVTGASSGIGRATATLLAQNGYKVYGFSRRKLSEAGVESIAVDVTDQSSVANGVAAVVRAEGRIDLLVNNAGVYLLGAAEESSVAQARALFETNFFGLLQVTQAVLPIMRTQRSGRIINISSVLGFIPSVYSALYGASKHAVEGYTEALDHEVRTLGIRALLVEPGFTRTELSSPAPDRPIADYAVARSRFEVLAQKGLESGDSVELVADVILKAARAGNPKLRYPAGPAAKRLALVRSFVPAGIFDRSLRKQFGLDVA